LMGCIRLWDAGMQAWGEKNTCAAARARRSTCIFPAWKGVRRSHTFVSAVCLPFFLCTWDFKIIARVVRLSFFVHLQIWGANLRECISILTHD
jgi:hypothetical protein